MCKPPPLSQLHQNDRERIFLNNFSTFALLNLYVIVQTLLHKYQLETTGSYLYTSYAIRHRHTLLPKYVTETMGWLCWCLQCFLPGMLIDIYCDIIILSF